MRKLAVVLGLVGLLNVSAFGGLVNFAVDNANVVQASGQAVHMDLTLQTQALSPGGFNGADVVIGSNDVPFSFAYSAAWTGAMANVSAPGPVGIYTTDTLVGGNNPAAAVGNSLLLGTVTINTAGLGIGTYHVQVNSDVDGFSGLARGVAGQPFVSEPISGAGSFSIIAIPEPATLSLLGLGLLGFLRRRFITA